MKIFSSVDEFWHVKTPELQRIKTKPIGGSFLKHRKTQKAQKFLNTDCADKTDLHGCWDVKQKP